MRGIHVEPVTFAVSCATSDYRIRSPETGEKNANSSYSTALHPSLSLSLSLIANIPLRIPVQACPILSSEMSPPCEIAMINMAIADGSNMRGAAFGNSSVIFSGLKCINTLDIDHHRHLSEIELRPIQASALNVTGA